MSTPLYKRLRESGNTIYAFPGAAEDISLSNQNPNFKMNFSKFALLNIPKVEGDIFDFEGAFGTSNVSGTDFSEQFVESLRNYVANHEVVIRESKLNNTNYFYDPNANETTTERIFFKWMKMLNLIDFEPAIQDDEYISSLTEFERRNLTDPSFFPEFLWKERSTTSYPITEIHQVGGTTSMGIKTGSDTTLRIGDTVIVQYNEEEPITTTISNITEDGIITLNEEYLGETLTSVNGYIRLVYSPVIQYIGEVNGVSNNKNNNRAYTEVYIHIPDHCGKTPDVLFRTNVDTNYRPNLQFPILNSQIQPEIIGAELYNSPIVNSPQNYPGGYMAQFDTNDNVYKTAGGDTLRRSGDYFGVSGTIDAPIYAPDKIDGLGIDFNTSHYSKMNLHQRVLSTFEEFNSFNINGEAPKAFEFNAILWYYDVEDEQGNIRTNLYGISLLDHPDNNEIDPGIKFPTYKKFVSNGYQDGTSYAFSLNLNYNITNDNNQDRYNPDSVNSVFSMNLFNTAMSRLANTNDSFLTLISEQGLIRDEVDNLKQLIYTTRDIDTINFKINSLENLLRLYSTQQIVSSDSIQVMSLDGNPPQLRMSNISTEFDRVYNYNTSAMFSLTQGIIPINISVPYNRTFMLNILNDDMIDTESDNLVVILDKDLSLGQRVEININGSETSTQNKRLDIYMLSEVNGENIETLVMGNIDLPVYYNEHNSDTNSAYKTEKFSFDIDFDRELRFIKSGYQLRMYLKDAWLIEKSINKGDTLTLNDFFIGVGNVYNMSGQYRVEEIFDEGIFLSLVSNRNLTTYMDSLSFTDGYHDISSNELHNKPWLSLNKGKMITITRVSDSENLSERYLLDLKNNI